MQHGIYSGSGAMAGLAIADITLDEFGSRRDPFALAIDQAVKHPHAMARRQQAFAKMAAYKTGAAGDQYIFHVRRSYIACGKNPDPPVC